MVFASNKSYDKKIKKGRCMRKLRISFGILNKEVLYFLRRSQISPFLSFGPHLTLQDCLDSFRHGWNTMLQRMGHGLMNGHPGLATMTWKFKRSPWSFPIMCSPLCDLIGSRRPSIISPVNYFDVKSLLQCCFFFFLKNSGFYWTCY